MICRLHHIGLAVTVAAFGLTACEPAEQETSEEAGSEVTVGLLDVTARDFAFEAPDEIPSGWTTVQLRNVGAQEHFAYLYRLPDGVTFEEYREQVLVPFDTVWNAYTAGELDRAGTEAALGAALPAWFFTEVTPSGGPALTEPGATSVAIVKLEPGTYVMECYVKTPDGRWHTMLGMARPLVVTEDSTGVAPPDADVELTLSNYEIAVSGELTAGEQTIAVHVEENPDGFMKHDINLIRLDGDTSLDEAVAWMDWMDLEGFRAPAPGFSVGGLEHIVAGRTGYITVDLTPGNYAWVSEGYGARGMVHEFTVP